MRYFLANFKRNIPQGISQVTSMSGFQIYSVSDEMLETNPFDGVTHEEIPEIEGTVAWKFYGEVRGYRSAYSDVEGLEPDADELAKGKRKTKVYHTPETEAATLSLLKRVFRLNVQEIFDARDNRDGEQEILNAIESCTTAKEIAYKKEELLGIEMSRTQLRELFMWDEATDSRIGKMHFILGF